MKKNGKSLSIIKGKERELILKVIYGQIKFNESIKLTQSAPLTFFTLKAKIYEELKKLNEIKTEYLQQMQITDKDGFLFLETDKIQSFLKNNDIINVKFRSQQNNTNQANSMIKEQEQSQSQQDSKIPVSQIEEQKQSETQNTTELKEDPKEAICVLYDTSGSMAHHFFTDTQLSRIGAVNSWFSAFADKTLVFEFNHIVQLICFSSTVQVKCEFNDDFEKFIALVNDVKASGGSQLYGAISQAIKNLIKIKQQYPNIILRIIALTDGEDNSQSHNAQNLVQKIIENKIIIDSFVVGENCIGLKTLTHASGGRCYCPQKLNIGMQLFEIETILSVEARDIGTEGLNPNIDLNTLKGKPFDTEGIQQTQESIKQETQRPEEIIKTMEDQQKSGQHPTYVGSQKRIFKEMNDFINSPLDQIKIFPSKESISSWKALLIGPKNTSYNQGVYLISIQFPTDYPFKPPKVQFLTKIFHCNISQQGSICLDILRDKWNPQFTISTVFKKILELLQNPNLAEALETCIASLMMHQPELFKQKVNEETLKFANQDCETLVQLVAGRDLDQSSDEFSHLKKEIETWLTKNRNQEKFELLVI